MNKPFLFFLTLIFLSSGFSAYSYSSILVCGIASCGPAYTPPPFQGGGGSGGNISNVTNQTNVTAPIAPTGFAITVSTWLNDFTNLIVSFLITEEGPQKIIIGRVVFFAIIVVSIFLALGIFFGDKKVKKYLAPKTR